MIDRIEREIRIDAPIERVFALVSEPGWWIADGDERTVTRDGDLTYVELPQHGRFPVLPVSSDAPRHVAFRGAPGDAATDGTLVEFFLSAQDGGTLLRVVESELHRMAPPWDDVEDNIEGWTVALAAVRQRVAA